MVLIKIDINSEENMEITSSLFIAASFIIIGLICVMFGYTIPNFYLGFIGCGIIVCTILIGITLQKKRPKKYTPKKPVQKEKKRPSLESRKNIRKIRQKRW